MIRGYAGRVLDVDLAARAFAFGPLDEDTARLYLGGKGYATRLLYDLTPAGADPLSSSVPPFTGWKRNESAASWSDGRLPWQDWQIALAPSAVVSDRDDGAAVGQAFDCVAVCLQVTPPV